ncbi:CU044_2847 family protein [Catenulispora subtropica]
MDVIQIPVDGGGRLFVEAVAAEADTGELTLAARSGLASVNGARESLETALDQIKPAIEAIGARLRALEPDSVTVEFGLMLSAEAGLIVAKGTSEVHFTVSVNWSGGAEPEGK